MKAVKSLCAAVAFCGLGFGGPALAHHSSAMFSNQSITLKGTVKEFQWTNPHCWIQVLVPKGSGTEEWSVEMGSPIQLYRGAWRPGTLKAGDPITVVVHPLKDGDKGGLFISGIGGGIPPHTNTPGGAAASAGSAS